jgi:hypothetical protein
MDAGYLKIREWGGDVPTATFILVNKDMTY